MTPIDPAEALLASIGVRPIVSHFIERITLSQWQKAENIGRDCDALAKQMVAGKLPNLTYNDFDRIDYGVTLRDLSTPYVPAQVEAMVAHIPPALEGLHGSFIALAAKTFQYLYSQFPIVLRESVAGNNNIPPPRSLMNRFECLLWVLDNPLGVLSLIQNATLTQHQVDGLRAVYPTLCQYLENESVPTAMEDARLAKPGWQLTRQTEQGVRKFFGRLPLPPGLNQILQTTAQSQQNQPGKMPPKPTGPLSTETAPRSVQIQQGAAP